MTQIRLTANFAGGANFGVGRTTPFAFSATRRCIPIGTGFQPVDGDGRKTQLASGVEKTRLAVKDKLFFSITEKCFR